jgi:murein DD-endopeptidase MepM/ murein hydrolase activator NlpD
MRQLFGSPDGVRDFHAQLQAAGSEIDVVEEGIFAWSDNESYSRLASFSHAPEPLLLEWSFDGAGTILGLLIRPAPQPAPTRFLGYRTMTPLHLPFTRQWFVFWGGRSVIKNYHASSPDQRFACDFVQERAGRSFEGDPSENESYLCFGKQILAPSAGLVVEAVDGMVDNTPGQMNADQPLGNHIVLDHGTGEFSFLAHLKNGTVAFHPGQTVAPGETLGACGNSGRSSEPHLHFHLQTTPRFQDGEGLPTQFLDYFTGDEHTPRGEPERGQRIRAPEHIPSA